MVSPVVSDNCDTNPVLVFSETSNQTNNGACTDQNYTVIRTWTASDQCGNSAQISQIISVVDAAAPVFTNVPANVTANCDAGPPPTTPAATDNCDASPEVILVSEVITGSCSTQNYSLIRTWRATDNCGNTSEMSQVISIVDMEPPVFSNPPSDITLNCGDPVPPATSPNVADNCDQTPAVVLNEVSAQTNNGSCSDLSYTITRTWTAIDDCGNTTVAVQIIQVSDTQPPVISGVPAKNTES